MKKILLKIIKIYQASFFFNHTTCRFLPTCSEYSYRAIQKYGILKGGVMSFKRILKCNPLNKGGLDLLK